MTDEELVREIAQKVMGWTRQHASASDKGNGYWIGNDAFEIIGQNMYRITGDWNPLTNANHTMMVVERMRELGFNFKVWAYHDWKGIEVGFSKYRYPNLTKSESFGHAVCLASLKAVEND